MPSKIDLEIYQGDTFAAAITVQNQDGTPANISAYTARAHLRRDVADADPDIDAEITCFISSPNISLSMTHEVTTALSGAYVWDCELIGPSAEVITVAAGKAKIIQEVTRVA